MSATLRSPDGCLDAETLAALIDGRLDASSRERAQRHIASCMDCYEVFINTVRTWPSAAQVPSAASRHRRHMAWSWVAIAAGLTFAVVTLGLLLPRLLRPTTLRPELHALVSAVGAHRPVDARLTGGFAWGPLDPITRGGEGRPVSPEIQIAAANLERTLDRSRSASNLAAFGVSRLVLHEPDAAVAALREAISIEAGRADFWSDLSGALIAQAGEPDRQMALPQALDAADRALALSPSLPEALFNKALALERLNLRTDAREAWTAYVAAERSAIWQAEGRRHLDALAQETPAGRSGANLEPLRQQVFGSLTRAWIDAVDQHRSDVDVVRAMSALVSHLETTPDRMASDFVHCLASVRSEPARQDAARAHEAFLRVQDAMTREDLPGAQEAIARALPGLQRMNSPAALTVRFNAAVIVFRRQHLDDAYDLFDALRAESVERHYAWMQGRAEWMLGVIDSLRGHIASSTTAYLAAVQHLRAAGDIETSKRLYGLLATNLDATGDTDGAWRFRALAIDDHASPGALLSASLAALRNGWPWAASSLTEAAYRAARQSNSATNLADVIRVQATVQSRLRNRSAIRALVTDARALAAQHPDPEWDRLRAEIAIAEAEASTVDGATGALSVLGPAMAYFAASHADGRLPEIYALRASLEQQAHLSAAAARDVRVGLDLLDRQRAHLLNGTEQATFEDVERRLANQLADLATTDTEAIEAFLAVDRCRGRDIAGAEPLRSFDALQARLGADTVLVSYAITERAAFAWTVTSATAVFRRMATDEQTLTTLVRAARPPRSDAAALARLSRLVLEAVEPQARRATHWVIVPDGALRALPFALLADEEGHPLSAKHTLSISPSAASWIRARSPRDHTQATTMLVVSRPSVDPRMYPGLRMLSEAGDEAAAVARRYAGARVLEGAFATHDALLRELGRTTLVHYAGHAVVNPWVADASYLPLAGPSPARVTAADIRTLDLHRSQLVVLAACETATDGVEALGSPLNLARAFLSAGAANVIGSLWPVDDHATRALFDAFYSDFARTGDAAASLRAAQLALASSSDPDLHNPHAWAAFVAMGGSPATTPHGAS